MSLRKFALAAIFLFFVAAAPALAQPSQMRINFTVTAPFELKKGGVVLPPGKYVLFQLSTSDRHLFALYQNDMTHSPVAILRTARVPYFVGWLPDRTRLFVDTDEATPQLYPILNGWDVPGDDGYEVIFTSVRKKQH